ncbi:MAG: hypothetical protein Aurels2KO_20310 [Aureliella sp.]
MSPEGFAMPRTASIQKTTRGARKTRAASEISAPVLFRFPDLSAAADEASAPAPAAAQETEAVAATESVIEKTATEDTPAPAATVQPKPVSPETESSREDAPRVDAAAVAAHRTWWEHWSSGIVLLILACALLAAGVMAFSDRSGPSEAELADSGTAELNIPKLSDIEIPDIDTSLTRTDNALVVPPEADISEPEPPQLAQSQPQPTLSADSEPSLQTSQADNSTPSPAEAGSLVPSGFVLGNDKTSGPALSIQVESPESQKVAKATVGMPIVDGEQTQPSIAPDRQIGFSLPALPVSDTQQQPGDSPSMYDGAMVGNPTNQSSQQDLPPLPTKTQAPATQQDSGNLIPSSLATSSNPETGAAATAPQGTQTQLASGPNHLPVQGASHTTQRAATSPAGTASPSNQPVVTAGGAMQTASPDWDPEAVVRKWKQYKAKQLTSQPGTYLPPPGR